jgi:hypothetical protein
MRPKLIVLAWALGACATHAQIVAPDPDWRETQAPPPPALKLDGLIPLDIPESSLRFGVAPESIAIGGDGIVRYVVVAKSNTGAVNAMYEGINCRTGEYKVYARHNPDSGWTSSADSPWKPLRDRPLSRHSLLMAQSGACMGHGPSHSAARIIQDLRAPFGGDTRR